MIATLDASTAAKIATQRATLLNPEESPLAADGSALGDTASGEAVAPGEALTDGDAVGLAAADAGLFGGITVSASET